MTYISGWKLANVQAVPKKGSRSYPANYRPVAVASILATFGEAQALKVETIEWSLDVPKVHIPFGTSKLHWKVYMQNSSISVLP